MIDDTTDTKVETPPAEETPATPAASDAPPEDKPIEPVVRMVTEEVTEDTPKDESDAEVDPEDDKVINRLVDKRLNPVTKRIEEQSNMIEVTGFITINPDYAKYKESIIKHMNHPAYKNIPVDRIAKMVAGDDLIKIGAAREREAQAKAAATRTGGTAPRITPTGKDWHTATKEDYNAQRAAVLGQGR